MIEDTEAYKGRKFICKNCGYVVSSDATDDFDVLDFVYCPYCGNDERLDNYLEALAKMGGK